MLDFAPPATRWLNSSFAILNGRVPFGAASLTRSNFAMQPTTLLGAVQHIE
jgi:hypothetical protein